MDASRYLTCFWPGLSELWYRGRWSALPAAVAFAVVLNFLLIARFVYPEWLAPSLVRLACWVGIAAWFVLAFRAAGRLPSLLQPRAAAEVPDRYPEACSGYLQGRWSETEAVLAGCLEVDPRDCQSLLLLAAVYRHTQRFEAAELTLKQLDRLETADGWWLEREAERKRLERDQPGGKSPPVDDPNPAVEGSDSDTTPEPERASGPEDSWEAGGLEGPPLAVTEAAGRVSKSSPEQEQENGEPPGGEPREPPPGNAATTRGPE